MEVRHCTLCLGTGSVPNGDDCPHCDGTGHEVICPANMYKDFDCPIAPPIVIPHADAKGLHDPEYCSGYISGSCEDEPCIDCELAYEETEVS